LVETSLSPLPVYRLMPPCVQYVRSLLIHTQPFNGLWSGTTRVGRNQKKHSPTHTHPDHRASFISFLHCLYTSTKILTSILLCLVLHACLCIGATSPTEANSASYPPWYGKQYRPRCRDSGITIIFAPPPGKHSLRALVHLRNFGIINSDRCGTVK